MFNWILEIGPIKFIFYSIYFVVKQFTGDLFPDLALIIISIIIMVILVGCPMIGFYSAFGSTFSAIVGFIYSIFKAIVYLLSTVFGKQFGMTVFNKSMVVYEYILNVIQNTDWANLDMNDVLYKMVTPSFLRRNN